ncbi:hypothetical protein N657DRAFT_625063 [Parathielavia appendiculata]|uniref:chitinase n=1 Tax=Parathielavia appendiculata TaxID=2587402 RepID=A0AAN6Z046_9PEZI|nr:hypothetical protein N657DRAFT_625063 [Parathielavia appendiculata]
MARVGIPRPGFWDLATLSLLVLCLLSVLYTTTSEHQRGTFRQHPRRWPFPREQRRDATIHVVPVANQGPAHHNPARAPPRSLPSPTLGPSSPVELSDLSSRSSFLAARHAHHNISLAKRDGPLRCNDGPCIDGSCCSKDHICGFGPDFCGAGCLSQCNAKAMCGEHSENGEIPCGLKLCCSAMGWCGITTEFCHNADPLRGTLPCQAGYGSCYISGTPSCPYGGGSTNGRMVGYYQSWNVRNRVCNKVAPRDLNTTGYTHLFYSFASIDPATYRIAPAHADDQAMMREFTSLAKDGLQTWIAIGGFDFSDPGTPTHTTWSDICATKARRAAFINSVREYMDEYGFQGVDLDWEYPGDPSRGGNGLDDTKNLVLLVKEMRAAYGNTYGISLTLAPDYWYLRWFDPKGMEPYVDFFGFMAYDLHGSWDSDVLTLGKKVRGQADIREIADNTVPLWFDGLDPAKINFGLAMYGRGYTLADPSCNQLLCPFSGASDPAPCTNSNGVMSLLEIQQLIKRRGLTPQYLADSMMKQITWDDQWIGYDDEETFAAKKAWADSRCFGGTMVWSIDFQVTGSGNFDDEAYGDVVYVGSEVFQIPTVQCPAPCVMVFPPSSLSEPKVITIPPYTATLEVGTTTTTVVVVPTKVTTIITVIDFFNQYITSEQQPGAVLTLRPSFQPPPATVLVTGEEGRTTIRTVLLPPLGGGVVSGPAQNQTEGVQTTLIPPPATDWPWVLLPGEPSKTATYLSGTPSPTCTTNCGTYCTDFWCRPDQTDQPPLFTEATPLPPNTTFRPPAASSIVQPPPLSASGVQPPPISNTVPDLGASATSPPPDLPDHPGQSTVYSGDLTYFQLGVGACGFDDSGKDLTDNIVAVSAALMGAQSNGNPICNKSITIKANGNTIHAIVRDRCMSCAVGDIDGSEKIFNELFGSLTNGRQTIEWWFNN